jgi:hypothetical protein
VGNAPALGSALGSVVVSVESPVAAGKEVEAGPFLRDLTCEEVQRWWPCSVRR